MAANPGMMSGMLGGQPGGMNYGVPPSAQDPFSKADAVHRVDWANYAGMDVTQKMNELIGINGIRDPTAGESLLRAFGEPAKGKIKILKVAKGASSLSFEENRKKANIFDLAQLFEDRSGQQ